MPLQIITRAASTRVAEYAFKYAQDNGRKKVSAVHKANIMKLTDGLFIKCCREGAPTVPLPLSLHDCKGRATFCCCALKLARRSCGHCLASELPPTVLRGFLMLLRAQPIVRDRACLAVGIPSSADDDCRRLAALQQCSLACSEREVPGH